MYKKTHISDLILEKKGISFFLGILDGISVTMFIGGFLILVNSILFSFNFR